jgi:hypothetical protein
VAVVDAQQLADHGVVVQGLCKKAACHLKSYFGLMVFDRLLRDVIQELMYTPEQEWMQNGEVGLD